MATQNPSVMAHTSNWVVTHQKANKHTGTANVKNTFVYSSFLQIC